MLKSSTDQTSPASPDLSHEGIDFDHSFGGRSRCFLPQGVSGAASKDRRAPHEIPEGLRIRGF